MKKLAIPALIAAALAMAGCTPYMDHGVVTGKQHTSSDTIYYPSIGGSDYYVPNDVPEKFTLYLQDADKSGSIEVDEGAFNSYNVGDAYPKP